jgi:hypothetical protein
MRDLSSVTDRTIVVVHPPSLPPPRNDLGGSVGSSSQIIKPITRPPTETAIVPLRISLGRWSRGAGRSSRTGWTCRTCWTCCADWACGPRTTRIAFVAFVSLGAGRPGWPRGAFKTSPDCQSGTNHDNCQQLFHARSLHRCKSGASACRCRGDRRARNDRRHEARTAIRLA